MNSATGNTSSIKSQVLASKALENLMNMSAVIPCQFVGNDTKAPHQAERNLMAAVLSDGVEEFVRINISHKVKRQSDIEEILDWVDSEDDSYVYSFQNICNQLGINAEYLRVGMNKIVAELKTANEDKPMKRPWKAVRRS